MQIGVDQIVERVDTVLGGAAVPLRFLRGGVGIDGVLPPSEQDISVRRHVDGVRHDGHADRIIQRRRQRAIGQSRVVVTVNDIVAYARMLGHLGKEHLQHSAGLELIRSLGTFPAAYQQNDFCSFMQNAA